MDEESYNPIRSEKKKRNPEPEMEVEEEEEEDNVIKSEKKKKKKDRTSVAEMEEDDDDKIKSEEKKKKKKKKKNRNPVEEMEEEEDDDIIRDEEKKKKKKKKKDRNPVEEVEEENDDNVIGSEEKKEKKKRQKIDVRMEIVPEHPDMTAPLVGYFPSGFDPQKACGQPDVKIYRHKQRANRLQLVVSPRNSKIDFVGTSYAGEGSASQVCTYALGVLDKETQCLKIVPIASNKIFRLEPRVAGSDSYEKALVEVKEEALTGTERAERVKKLTIGLGTKRARKEAKKQDTMNRKEDASVEKDMEKKIKSIVVNKQALEITAALAVRNIPPHDSTATTPEQAYPLDKIILQSEWHYLRDVLQCVQSEKELPSNVYPSFVCNRAQKLLEIKDEMERDTLAGIFSFLNHLIKFKDQRSYATKDFVKSHRVPEILFQKFNTMFTDPGRLEPSDEKKDLLVSYVLVLSLYADSFKTDPFDIAKDLRMTKLTLRQHFLSLGCKVSRVDKQDVMTLPVPLEFPKPMLDRRRR